MGTDCDAKIEFHDVAKCALPFTDLCMHDCCRIHFLKDLAATEMIPVIVAESLYLMGGSFEPRLASVRFAVN